MLMYRRGIINSGCDDCILCGEAIGLMAGAADSGKDGKNSVNPTFVCMATQIDIQMRVEEAKHMAALAGPAHQTMDTAVLQQQYHQGQPQQYAHAPQGYAPPQQGYAQPPQQYQQGYTQQ